MSVPCSSSPSLPPCPSSHQSLGATPLPGRRRLAGCRSPFTHLSPAGSGAPAWGPPALVILWPLPLAPHRVWRSSLVAAVRLAEMGTADGGGEGGAEAVWTAGLSGARLGLCCRGKEVLVGVGVWGEGCAAAACTPDCFLQLTFEFENPYFLSSACVSTIITGPSFPILAAVSSCLHYVVPLSTVVQPLPPSIPL